MDAPITDEFPYGDTDCVASLVVIVLPHPLALIVTASMMAGAMSNWKGDSSEMPSPPPMERGQDLLEYAMIIMLVAIIVLAVLFVLGRGAGNMFSSVTGTI